MPTSARVPISRQPVVMRHHITRRFRSSVKSVRRADVGIGPYRVRAGVVVVVSPSLWEGVGGGPNFPPHFQSSLPPFWKRLRPQARFGGQPPQRGGSWAGDGQGGLEPSSRPQASPSNIFRKDMRLAKNPFCFAQCMALRAMRGAKQQETATNRPAGLFVAVSARSLCRERPSGLFRQSKLPPWGRFFISRYQEIL